MSQVPNDDAQSGTRSSQDRPDADLTSIPPFSSIVIPSTPTIVAQEQVPTQSISQEPTRPMPPFPLHRGKDTTIIATILAILFILSGTFLSTTAYNNHQSTIIANATATTQTYANATAITAHSTATAQAKILTNYPFSNDLVLNDTLNNNSNIAKYGWDTGNDCVFTNKTYQVTIDKTGYFSYCTASTVSFTNFTYEVQMSIQKGGNNAEGGVVFRANMSSSLFYVFYLSTNGYYDLDIQTNSNATNTRTLKTGTVAGFASGLSQVHTIGVVANGSQISLYIDRQLITLILDSTFSSGQIGVISAYGNSKTVVAYNNAKVWLLP